MSKGRSTGNLNRHLKQIHPNKINPPTIKQAELMRNFLQGQDNNKKEVS